MPGGRPLRGSRPARRARPPATVIGGERTKEYILETTGGGAAILDYDDDGWPDVFLVNGARRGGEAAPSRLYRNQGDGTFADVTGRLGPRSPGLGPGRLRRRLRQRRARGPVRHLLRPERAVPEPGRRRLRATRRGRPASSAPDRYSTGCAFLDYDRDGRLDLFVSAYLAYEDALRYPPGTPGQNCSWKGLVVMCGPAGLRGAQNVLYRGNADGTFTDVSERAGILKAGAFLRLHPARARLRQRRLARRVRGQRLARLAALPQRAATARSRSAG